jgi:phosphatidylglycerophosphate synthase
MNDQGPVAVKTPDPYRPLAQPTDSYGEIVAALAAVQKSNRGAPGYARWVNRKLGRRCAALAFRWRRTPNQVTAVSALFTAVGIVLLAVLRPVWWSGALVALLLLIGFALDAADGQLARLRGGGSPAGEWLDHIVDAVKCATLHLAVLICWYRYFDLRSAAWLLVPIAFAVQSSVFYFTIMLTEQLRRNARGHDSTSPPRTLEPAPVLRSIIVLPADYGFMALTFILIPWPAVFVVVYTALMIANYVFSVGAFRRWYSELANLR